MNRDIFRRGVRMTHKFGENEQGNDPLYGHGDTFKTNFPLAPKQMRSSPLEIQDHGETRMFNPPRSEIIKPTGQRASLNGPVQDAAADFAVPIHPSTKRRLGPLKTDK